MYHYQYQLVVIWINCTEFINRILKKFKYSLKNQWFCEIYNSQKLAGQVIADGHCSFRARSIWVPYITLFFSKNILKEWIFWRKIHLKMCKSTDSWKHYKTIFNYNHFPGLQRAEKSLIFLSPFAGLSALHVGRTYISCNQFLFSSF